MFVSASEDEPKLELETSGRLHFAAQTVVRAVEQVRARQESLVLPEVRQVEHVEIHHEPRVARQRDLLADAEVDVLNLRELELTVASRAEREARRRRQRIRH